LKVWCVEGSSNLFLRRLVTFYVSSMRGSYRHDPFFLSTLVGLAGWCFLGVGVACCCRRWVDVLLFPCSPLVRYRPRVLCLCRWCSNACGELRGWPCLCHMPCFVPFRLFYCACLIDISLWPFLAGDVLGFSLGRRLIFYLLGGCCNPFFLRIIRRPVPNPWLVCWPTFVGVYSLVFVCTQKVLFSSSGFSVALFCVFFWWACILWSFRQFAML